MGGYIHRSSPVSHRQPLLVRTEGVRQPAESVFACHLVRCGDAEEKRNENSTAHITGGSLGLSASVSRIPKGEKEIKHLR